MHDYIDKKHLVKGVRISGQKALYECDAVVLCAGSFIARILKE